MQKEARAYDEFRVWDMGEEGMEWELPWVFESFGLEACWTCVYEGDVVARVLVRSHSFLWTWPVIGLDDVI